MHLPASRSMQRNTHWHAQEGHARSSRVGTGAVLLHSPCAFPLHHSYSVVAMGPRAGATMAPRLSALLANSFSLRFYFLDSAFHFATCVCRAGWRRIVTVLMRTCGDGCTPMMHPLDQRPLCRKLRSARFGVSSTSLISAHFFSGFVLTFLRS